MAKKEADEKKIEIGMVVILNSGGPPMTAIARSAGSWECVWYGEDGAICQYSFPEAALSPTGDLELNPLRGKYLVGV